LILLHLRHHELIFLRLHQHLVQLPSDTGREGGERDGFRKCVGERNGKENEKIKKIKKIILKMIFNYKIWLKYMFCWSA
jgi:hypothetical protein